MSTTVIALVVVVSITLLVQFIFFGLGFRAGGRHYQSKLQRARFEAARAERQLHDLTRQAFVSMSEHAYDQKRRSS